MPQPTQPEPVAPNGAKVRKTLGHIGVDCEPPHITPARRPPLWDDCDDALRRVAACEADNRPLSVDELVLTLLALIDRIILVTDVPSWAMLS